MQIKETGNMIIDQMAIGMDEGKWRVARSRYNQWIWENHHHWHSRVEIRVTRCAYCYSCHYRVGIKPPAAHIEVIFPVK